MRCSSTVAASRATRVGSTVAIGLMVLVASVLIAVPSAVATGFVALEVSPGRSATALTGSSMRDGHASMSFTVPASTQRPIYMALQVRSTAPMVGYRARATVYRDGSLRVGLDHANAGDEERLTLPGVVGWVETGDKVTLETEVSGVETVTLKVRAWREGEAKPDWQQTYVDRSADRITAMGPSSVWAYLSQGAIGTLTVAVSDVESSSGPVPAPTPTPTSTPTPTTQPPTSGRPSPTNTGVRPGTQLTRHNGDIIVTKDGTHLDALDVYGFVVVRAENVKITNSTVRGGVSQFSQGLITSYGNPGLVIEDVRLVPQNPSVMIDGLKGDNFTARRLHITGGTDNVIIHGSNVLIEDSYLENPNYFAHSPYQPNNGPSHSDGIQILQGTNITIRHNTIVGAPNMGILGGAEHGNVTLKIQDNYLDGGHCTVKLQVRPGRSETAQVTNNRFGPNREVASCVLVAYPEIQLSASGNVMDQTGATVEPFIWKD